jgi:hypothetical protein
VLHIKPAALRGWILRGDIEIVKLGTGKKAPVRIKESTIEEIIERGTRKPLGSAQKKTRVA